MIDLSKLITAEDKFKQAKGLKLREIDQHRDAALGSGIDLDGVIFDSDQKSIQRISALATLSLMDPEFTTQYITRDNEVITLDASGIARLGVAAATHEATQVFKARSLKDQVIDAKTTSELAAITWDSDA